MAEPRSSQRWRDGHRPGISDNRVAWVSAGRLSMIKYVDLTEDPPGIDLVFSKGTGKFVISIENMTEPEIIAFRKFLVEVFDEAQPIAAQRDREALDEYESGIDTNPRLYRQPPFVVDRSRGERSHDPMLYQRPEPTSDGEGAGDRGSDDARDSNAGLAERGPDNVERQNDTT